MSIGWRTRAVLLLVVCATLSLAQVQNGSFESPTVSPVPGWVITDAGLHYWNVTNAAFPTTPTDHLGKLEFHLGNAYDGSQYMELDVFGGTLWTNGVPSPDTSLGTSELVWQNINGLTPGMAYNLMFAFKGRPGYTNGMSVYVKDGQTDIANVNVVACGGGICADDNETNPWVQYSLSFTAGNGQTSIWFTEGGIDDGFGDWLDDVSIEPVNADIPEPGTIAMVLGGLALVAIRRR